MKINFHISSFFHLIYAIFLEQKKHKCLIYICETEIYVDCSNKKTMKILCLIKKSYENYNIVSMLKEKLFHFPKFWLKIYLIVIKFCLTYPELDWMVWRKSLEICGSGFVGQKFLKAFQGFFPESIQGWKHEKWSWKSAHTFNINSAVLAITASANLTHKFFYNYNPNTMCIYKLTFSSNANICL